jgi:hypothetical protein
VTFGKYFTGEKRCVSCFCIAVTKIHDRNNPKEQRVFGLHLVQHGREHVVKQSSSHGGQKQGKGLQKGAKARHSPQRHIPLTYFLQLRPSSYLLTPSNNAIISYQSRD